MKTVSAALSTHLAGAYTTLAYCWLVTRTDGTVFAFTNHDQPLTYNSVVYEPFSGFTRSAVRATSGLAVNNMDVDGFFSSDAITEADLLAGLWDFATLRAFVVNWADLTQGELKSVKGKLGQVKAGRIAFTAELRSLIQELQQIVGRLYGVLCDADLGDSRCNVDMDYFTFTGTITGVTSNRVFADTSRVEAAGYFDFGKITWTSGLNDTLSMEIKTFTSPTIGLQLPMPYTVAIGDTYEIEAGCDKKASTCKDKFSNRVNFRGYEWVPSTDQVISGGING